MTTGIVFDIKRFSIHDGPGIRTTVFLKGCPLHCPWCHNPESQNPDPGVMLYPGRCIACGSCVDACPEHAISRDAEGKAVTDPALCKRCGTCTEYCYAEARRRVGQEMTVDEIVEEVERDRDFYEESGGGVTLSGGEPLAQKAFALELLRASRERGIRTAVDTCGAVAWSVFEAVRPYTDLFLYDIKHMDDAAHRENTGAGNRRILENLEKLSELGHAINLRFALIPGINDDEENVRRTGAFAAALPNRHPVSVLPFHAAGGEKYKRLGQSYTLGELGPPQDHRIAGVARLLEAYDLEVRIGG